MFSPDTRGTAAPPPLSPRDGAPANISTDSCHDVAVTTQIFEEITAEQKAAWHDIV